MSSKQPDLFEAFAPEEPPPDPVYVEKVRQRLNDMLATARAAERFPWKDQLACVMDDNHFRWSSKVLPPDEGPALYAAYDAELDRLYAIWTAELALLPD